VELLFIRLTDLCIDVVGSAGQYRYLAMAGQAIQPSIVQKFGGQFHLGSSFAGVVYACTCALLCQPMKGASPQAVT
jgi:hypothetical protein